MKECFEITALKIKIKIKKKTNTLQSHHSQNHHKAAIYVL